MVFGVVGIVLVIVGFVGPWWTVDTSASLFGQTVSSTAEFRLFGGTATVKAPGFNQTNTTDYSNEPNTRSVFLTGAALAGVAIALGVVMVVLAAMAGSRPSFRRLAAACGILAFVLALVAALYVMASLPAAVNQDSQGGPIQISGFWGTSSTTFLGATATVTWAAGWAWYVVLVGAIVFLIGGIVALVARRGTAARAPGAAQGPPESPPEP